MSVPVYVLNIRGLPLMPTTAQKARKLLRNEKAKLVERLPFTIQLIQILENKSLSINLSKKWNLLNMGKE